MKLSVCYYTAMEEEKKFVKLATVYGPAEGEIIKGRLQSEGIEAILKAESLRNLYGIHVDGLGKVEIWVPEKDLEKAQILLTQPPSEDREG